MNILDRVAVAFFNGRQWVAQDAKSGARIADAGASALDKAKLLIGLRDAGYLVRVV